MNLDDFESTLESVDEFCIEIKDVEENIERNEWIISADADEFHKCESGWTTLGFVCDKKTIPADEDGYGKHQKGDGFFTGVVKMKCDECNQKFDVQYSEAADNPETINKEDYENGNW